MHVSSWQLGAAAALAVVFSASQAEATAYVVTLSDDAAVMDPTTPNAGSLRWCIEQVNASPAPPVPHSIEVLLPALPRRITVRSTLTITESVHIIGHGVDLIASPGPAPTWMVLIGTPTHLGVYVEMEEVDLLGSASAPTTGVAVTNSSSLTHYDSQVSGFGGRGIYVHNSGLTGSALRLANNAGGAVSVYSGTVYLESSTVLGNRATEGAGIYAESASVYLFGVVFDSNKASSSGAAIKLRSSELLSTELVMVNGNAPNGGGVDADHSFVGADLASFENNVASIGGALRGVHSVLRIRISQFRGNRAGIGGAIHWLGQPPNRDDINRVEQASFVANLAGVQGGAVYLFGPPGTSDLRTFFENVTFTGNDANTGGDLAIRGNDLHTFVQLRHCTLSGSTAARAGALFADGAPQIQLRNSVLDAAAGGNCSLPASPLDVNTLDTDGTCALSHPDSISNVPADLLPCNTWRTSLVTCPPDGWTSNLVDRAANASCLPRDEESVPRPQGRACDLGAIELD